MKILSQNWGINFCFCGFIFILFLKILASKARNTADHVPSFEILEIETKLHLQGLNFKLEFWDKNLQNRPWCAGSSKSSFAIVKLAKVGFALTRKVSSLHLE